MAENRFLSSTYHGGHSAARSTSKAYSSLMWWGKPEYSGPAPPPAPRPFARDSPAFYYSPPSEGGGLAEGGPPPLPRRNHSVEGADAPPPLVPGTCASVVPLHTFQYDASGYQGQVETDEPHPSALLYAAASASEAVHDLFDSARSIPSSDVTQVTHSDTHEDDTVKELMEAVRVLRSLYQNPRTESESPDCHFDARNEHELAQAAAMLLEATVKVQRELLAQNINADTENQQRNLYFDNPVWTEGLVSAAQYVVATVRHYIMMETEVKAGRVKEEHIVAAAQAVSGATAQLIAASRVKRDKESDAGLEQEMAAKQINQLIQHYLVAIKAAMAKGREVEQKQQLEKYTLSQDKLVQLEAQARVAALEAEVQQAREEVLRLRKTEYTKPQNADT